jgi:hypothetical protein
MSTDKDKNLRDSELDQLLQPLCHEARVSPAEISKWQSAIVREQARHRAQRLWWDVLKVAAGVLIGIGLSGLIFTGTKFQSQDQNNFVASATIRYQSAKATD